MEAALTGMRPKEIIKGDAKLMKSLRGFGTDSLALSPCGRCVSLDVKAPMCVLSLLKEKTIVTKGLGEVM